MQSLPGHSSLLTHIIRCEAKSSEVSSVWCFRLTRMARKEGFYRVELIKTVWEVPERYQNLLPVGHGAFGQVGTGGSQGGSLTVTHFRFVLPRTPSGELQMAPR